MNWSDEAIRHALVRTWRRVHGVAWNDPSVPGWDAIVAWASAQPDEVLLSVNGVGPHVLRAFRELAPRTGAERRNPVTYPKPYLPRVVITTPPPTPEHPVHPGVLTRITVDGQDWMVTEYSIAGRAKDDQKVTLTFYADVVVSHEYER